MPDSTADRNPLDLLAGEFADRLRRGERPSVEEYCARYPDLAEQIRELFPALEMMEQAAPPASSKVVPAPVAMPERLGDFRVLRQVGKGGMGIVYEAVQESLGRHVALKVLPADLAADERFLERFRREARAAARLHHTNIVPVFGVGECNGLHFYAMQFIHGQPLDKVLEEVRRLRGGPDAAVGPVARSLVSGSFRPLGDDAAPAEPPDPVGDSSPSLGREPETRYWTAVARLGAQAADGLAYAHEHGVTHRDVKPSNLLLDLSGTAWVADFGLAKSAEVGGLTEAGELVGTLRYMAPERFRGVTEARSDVYGLGVTLYELLTLRPAYDERDRLRLIETILRAPPPRPRLLDPRIPRDLETVVLKALAHAPNDRYASAGEFADDLRRWLTGRPVKARRHSPPELLWRWCKRNPVVAGLSAGLFVAVTAGVTASTVFGMRANQEAKRASWEAGRASQEAERASAREQDAVEAERKTELYVVRSLLRRIGYNPKVIDPAEVAAFREVAAIEQDRLRLLFLEQALSDPESAFRVARRTTSVIQAAVGTSESRRQHALTLTSARQRDGVDVRVRLAACWLAIELGSTDLPAFPEAISYLVGCSAGGLSDYVARMPDRLPTVYIQPLSESLAAVLDRTTDRDTWLTAGRLLIACVDRMAPATAAKVADRLVAVLGRTTDYDVQLTIAAWLSRYAGRLGSLAAANLAETLVAVLGRAPREHIPWGTQEAVAACAARLEPALAAKVAETLIALIAHTTESFVLQASADGLVACAARLEPEAARALITRAADTFMGVLGRTAGKHILRNTCEGLMGSAARLEPGAARTLLAQAAEALIGILSRASDDADTFEGANEGLAAILATLEPVAAQPLLARAAEVLLGTLSRTEHPVVKLEVATGLVRIAARFEPAAAAKVADALVAVLGRRSADGMDWGVAGMGLRAFAGRLEPAAAAKLADTLVTLLGTTQESGALVAASKGLSGCAGRLEPAAAGKVANALAAVLNRTTDVTTLWTIGKGLVACAARMEFAEAKPLLTRAAEAMQVLLGRTNEREALTEASEALMFCASRLEPAVAAKLADALLAVLARTTDSFTMRAASEGLVVCATQLEPLATQQLLTRAADTQLSMLRRIDDSDFFYELEVGRALEAYVPYLDSTAAVKLFEALVAMLGQTTTRDVLWAASTGMTACATRIASDKAKRYRLAGAIAILDAGASQVWHSGYSSGCMSLRALIQGLDSHSQLTELLKHMGCCGLARNVILARLEELAFPPTDGVPQSTLPILTAPAPAAGVRAVLLAADCAERHVNRRFRTTWDAVAWLRVHEPSFDPDAPYRSLR